MFSFPRTLKLKSIDGEVRLIQQPVSELDAAALGQTLPSDMKDETLDIHISAILDEESTLSLLPSAKEDLSRLSSATVCLARSFLSIVPRAVTYDMTLQQAGFKPPLYSLMPMVVRLRVLVDECSVEVFAGEGQTVISNRV